MKKEIVEFLQSITEDGDVWFYVEKTETSKYNETVRDWLNRFFTKGDWEYKIEYGNCVVVVSQEDRSLSIEGEV